MGLVGVLQGCVSSGSPIYVRMLPIALYWSLWRLRNFMLYDQVPPSLNFVKGLVMDFFLSATSFRALRLPVELWRVVRDLGFISCAPKQMLFKQVCWQLPPHSFYKLNVDGSSLGNPGPSGGGFIIRDDLGNFVSARALFFGDHQTCFYAEFYALLFGLEACIHMDVRRVLKLIPSFSLIWFLVIPLLHGLIILLFRRFGIFSNWGIFGYLIYIVNPILWLMD